MPPAVLAAPWLGAAIGGAATLGGAALAAHSSGKATKANLTAQQEALSYEKQKDAARKQEYDKSVEMYKAQMDVYNKNRSALARRYGINVPNAPMSVGQPSGGAGVPRVTLGSIMGRGQAPPSPQMEVPPEVQAPAEDPYAWNDWSQYASARR